MQLNIIHNEDFVTGCSKLDAGSINCCVTSPPYYALRDYGVKPTEWPEITFQLNEFTPAITIHEMECCLGLEPDPVSYIGHMVHVFRQVHTALRDDGTLWLNIGDSYATNNKKSLKQKDLIGIPWMLAFALRADGWYLRQDIIWSKPNPMPESVTDRCTKSHEYIFLLSKSNKYYFDNDSIKTPLQKSSDIRLAQDIKNQEGSGRVPGKMKAVVGGRKRISREIDPTDPMFRKGSNFREYIPNTDLMANRKSVWNIATQPFKEAHFATFPEELPELCIKAGCPTDGIVLDPFSGSGRTAITASKLGRNFIGFEIKPEYKEISDKQMHKELGLFKPWQQ